MERERGREKEKEGERVSEVSWIRHKKIMCCLFSEVLNQTFTEKILHTSVCESQEQFRTGSSICDTVCFVWWSNCSHKKKKLHVHIWLFTVCFCFRLINKEEVKKNNIKNYIDQQLINICSQAHRMNKMQLSTLFAFALKLFFIQFKILIIKQQVVNRM